MRLDHVDIFYSHRFDPDTPLEETMGALADAVRCGKALHVGISSYGPERTEEAARLLAAQGVPLLIHQPSYSMFNRWIEDELLNVTERDGIGVITFTALAQGLLTDKYLNGVPEDSRMRRGIAFDQDWLSDDVLARVRALNEIAARRDQTLAQMALAWVLRDPRVTSTLVGASSVQQLEQNVAALGKPSFDDAELAEIDQYAVESGIDLWRGSSSG
jgi:L-glyceraldehyde 3-phosphate reductase